MVLALPARRAVDQDSIRSAVPAQGGVMRKRKSCPICGGWIRPSRVWVLADKHGEIAGEYDTRSCAVADAFGPRFRRYTVRLVREERKR